MANTANMVYTGTGPTATGQILNDGTPGDRSRTLTGHASFTGDAATATAVISYIDGVKTLPFTPTAVIVTKGGGLGDVTNASTVVQAVSAITNTGFTVTFSGNVPATVVDLAVVILK